METSRVPVFQKRFRELRGDLPQAQFAEKIGLSRPTVGLYESGKRIPDIEVLTLIAEKCDVSADWLLGLSEYPTKDIALSSVCEYTDLSIAAVEALEIVAAENGSKYISHIIQDYGFELFMGMQRIQEATNDAKPVLLMAGDKSIMPPIKRLQALNDARTPLELSLFSFSELCRRIADSFGSYSVLEEFGCAYQAFLESTRKEEDDGDQTI